MTSRYRVLEDVALADMAFEASGDTVEELFLAAARAVIEAMVDPSTVAPARQFPITRTADDVAILLFDWLSEIVYRKDADGVVFREAKVHVTQEPQDQKWRLEGLLIGEAIDIDRHRLHADVKAVTKHLYDVSCCDGVWSARVVLDL